MSQNPGKFYKKNTDFGENNLLDNGLNRKIRELEEIKELYERALAGSSVGIWDWDILSNDLYSSDRTTELLGYKPNELSLTIDEFWNRLHPDDCAAVKETIVNHLKEHEPYLVDCRIQTKSGEYRWFQVRGQAIWNERGKATRMSGSLTDITKRKQAELELQAVKEYLDIILFNIPVGVAILEGPEFRYFRINQVLADLNGLPVEEHLARTVEEVLPKAAPAILPNLRKVFKNGEAILNREFSIRLPLNPGKEVDLIDWHFPIVLDGRIQAVGAIVMDITERKRSEKEIKKQHEQLVKAHHELREYRENLEKLVEERTAKLNEEILERKKAEQEAREQMDTLASVDRATRMGQLTGAIAHELNQPLTGILSNAQAAELMIKHGKIEFDEFAAILTDIVTDTKRAGEVIRNLREVYRKQKSEFLPVDMNAVVNETEHLLQSEFVMEHIILSTACDSSIPKVDGNWIQIQQVLVNLIMNAIEAMSDIRMDDRKLSITTAYDTKEVKTWVEDCGTGIKTDKIESIFELLKTWKPDGTGMGLAISNSIIEAHGGRMWAENRPEGGASVGYSIPVLKVKEGEKT